MPKPGYTGFQRIVKATGYSWQGLRAAWQNESAFRQECTLGILLLPLAFVIGQSMLQVAVLISLLVSRITSCQSCITDAGQLRVSTE